tara:strand:- start:85 stop:1938 length:1854 start_codon:yes stop_codon:yes gene_type:complete
MVTATGGVKVGTAATIHSTGQFNIGVAATMFANGNATFAGIVTASEFAVGTAVTIGKTNGNASFAGVVTASSFVGDGSGLTNAGPSLTGSTNNTIVTVTGANAIAGESNLTFDGTNTLAITGPEGGAARIDLIADQGDDAADKWRIANTSGNLFKIQRTTSHTDAVSIDTSGNSQFAGQVKVSSSNASTVAFSVGDTNTGFYNAGSNIFGYSISGTEKLRIDTAGRVQIGHNSSVVGGKVEVHAATAETQITINESSDSGNGPALYINRTRGSNLSSPSPVEINNYIGAIHFGSYDTNSYEKGASIEARADLQTWADGDCPGRLQFLTTPDGSTSPAERMRIHSGGQVSIGNASYTTQVHDYQLVVTPNISDNSKGALGLLIDGEHGTSGGAAVDAISLKVKNTNTWNNATHQYAGYFEGNQQLLQNQTNVYSQVTGLYSTTKAFAAKLNKNLGAVTTGVSYESVIVTTNSGGDAFHFRGYDNTTEKIRINKNGDIDNSNNSYGSLSDIKLKENIVDANSQWDDIKGLRIRNFNFKDDPDKVKMLGVVAQEAETVSAGLINTNNDIEVDDATGAGTVTSTTKYVKYSILYMKAVKALQEAQTRIETLETKVAALEGG